MADFDHNTVLSDEWLASVGFKWHQLERQPGKHWLLWLGSAVDDGSSFNDTEGLGIEVASCGYRSGADADWFCWLRSDCAGRYHRFIHIRLLRTVGDLVSMIEGLTGRAFIPADNFYGAMHNPERAAHYRQERERMDIRMRERAAKWSEIEKDDTRGGALPEHLEAHAKSMGQKP